MNTGKLMFLDDYLKSNDIKAGSYRSGYLPLLMAFNKNSLSTPYRMVQCPNRQAVCKPSKHHMAQEPEDKPKLLSYNDCIKSYDLTLLTPNKITVNHLLTISPIFADVSDAFGHILLHPDTALSCQIFLYKSTEDGKPTLDLTKAEVNENNEPIMFPLVYSHSSFGTKDLPMIFGYAMTQCVRFFREFSNAPLKMGEFKDPVLAEKVNLTRLNLVEKILCAAYVDDLSCHEFFLSLVSYFIDAYS